MNIFGSVDPERWLVVVFIALSIYFLWVNKHAAYNTRVKVLLTIPRAYLACYYLLVIFDTYATIPSVVDVVKTGTGSVYGIMALFAVEAYVRRQNKKYGRC